MEESVSYVKDVRIADIQRGERIEYNKLPLEDRFKLAESARSYASNKLTELQGDIRYAITDPTKFSADLKDAAVEFDKASEQYHSLKVEMDKQRSDEQKSAIEAARKAEEEMMQNTFVQFFKTSTIADALAASGQYMGTTLVVKTIEEKSLEELRKQTEQLGKIAQFTSILSQPI